MDVKRKPIVAAVLGMLWVSLAIWQWGGMEEPVRVPLTNVSGRLSSSTAGRPTTAGLRVNLELLDAAKAQREKAFTVQRNIFASPASGGAPQSGGDPGSLQALDPNSERALQQQAAMAELSQYRYLGFLRMADGRKRHAHMAVLSKNEEVVVAKVGDRIDQGLVLKTITPEKVVIRDTGTRIEQTVPLSEEPPVQP
jgi:hypothetical protein